MIKKIEMNLEKKNKNEKYCKLRAIMDNIFFSGKDNIRFKKIVRLWLTRRVIGHNHKVLKSKLFGKESLIIQNPELEYRAIFESVARLKYNVKVTINNVSFFESSGINTTDLNSNYMGHGIECNGSRGHKENSRDFDENFFSIPMKMLNACEIKIVNDWVRSKSFKRVKVSKKSRFFCEYECIDEGIYSRDFNSWRNVHIEYKEVILSTILNELVEQVISDSLRFSHIVYSKKFDMNRISRINSIKQVDFIVNTRFYIIYCIISVIFSQLEVVLNETIGYHHIKELDSVLRADPGLLSNPRVESLGSHKQNKPYVNNENADELSTVALAEIYKNYIKSLKFIVMAFESRINFKQNK